MSRWISWRWVGRARERVFRTPWPRVRADGQGRARQAVAVVTVSYNTAELISQMLFALFRVVGPNKLAKVVVIDNGSTDASRPILEAMHDAGLIHAVFNRRQRYHGPALNQGFNLLARQAAAGDSALRDIRYVWVLDSDTVILRPSVVDEGIARIRESNAGLIGEPYYNEKLKVHEVPTCCMLIDASRVWQRSVEPFREAGAPARALQTSMRRRGIGITPFSFLTQSYVLHLGSGTAAVIYKSGDSKNRYLRYGRKSNTFYFESNPNGPALYERFCAVWNRNVPDLTPDAVVKACRSGPDVSIESVGQCPRTH